MRKGRSSSGWGRRRGSGRRRRGAGGRLAGSGVISGTPVREPVAAVSVGVVGGRILVDLDYAEDSAAEVDMNVVMTGSGKLIEVQGTAEGEPFSRERLDRMLDAAVRAGKRILRIQRGGRGGGGGKF